MRERPDIIRVAKLRRRVHASWKLTLLTAVVGGSVFAYAGLMPGLGVFGVVLLLALFRPAAEIYFSRQCHCPHCQADIFLEVVHAEAAEGVEAGVRCGLCGKDASLPASAAGAIVDID